MKQAGTAGRILLGVAIFFTLVSGVSAQTWAPTGSMTDERTGVSLAATITRLCNGQVLVTGGRNVSGTYLATAELYNPVTGAFTLTNSMTVARGSHTATLLPDCQVLIAGGETPIPPGIVASAEIYNPATGTFTSTGSMATTRSQHAAVLLSNGEVLVLGGEDWTHAALATAELYDPTTKTFMPTANIMTTTRRAVPRATLLADGRVLVSGGELFNNGPILASAEIYDPTTTMFTATGSMTVARVEHTSTLLPNGQVLITGGHSGPHDSPLGRDTAELYSPGTTPSVGTFTPIVSRMTSIRVGHAGTLLSTNRVLLAGGTNLINVLNSSELYDPDSKTFLPTAGMNDARAGIDFVLLNNGTVLAAGGNGSSGPLARAELYTSSQTNQPPIITSFTATPSSGILPPSGAGVPVTFTVVASDDGTIVQVQWDSQGNGSVDRVTTSLTTSFTYTTAGTFHPTVTVMDNDGATASATTTVVIETPIQALNDLTTSVQGLPLNTGQKNSLISKLNAASDAISGGNVNAACNQLSAFINEVNALVQSQQLTQATGSMLTDKAQAIKTAIGCS